MQERVDRSDVNTPPRSRLPYVPTDSPQAAAQSPQGLTERDRLLALQRSVGNQAMGELLRRHSKGITDAMAFRVKLNSSGDERWMQS